MIPGLPIQCGVWAPARNVLLMTRLKTRDIYYFEGQLDMIQMRAELGELVQA